MATVENRIAKEESNDLINITDNIRYDSHIDKTVALKKKILSPNASSEQPAKEEDTTPALPSFPALPTKYDPKTFTIRHEKMCQLYCEGHTVTSIAHAFNIGRSQASRIINSPTAQTYLAKLKNMEEHLWISRLQIREKTADDAVRLLHDFMTDEDTPIAIRVKIAEGALAALGEGAITKVESTNKESYGDNVKLLMERVEELKKELPAPEPTIDVPFKLLDKPTEKGGDV